MTPRQLLGCLLIALACGCAPQTQPQPRPATVRLRASTPDDAPVPGARFWLDGRAIGETGADGALRTRIAVSAQLTMACPPRYRTDTPERRVTVPAAPRGRELAITLRCIPERRLTALAVRTRGAPGGLPVLADDRVVGQTDVDGVAHVLLDSRPHGSLRVMLDTGAAPRLRPQDPVQTFRVGDADGVLLLEQSFERPARRKRRPHLALPERTTGKPVRIR
ncbi:MAG: hypothetical protein PVI30_02820 [Myxococcales bacterium]|jgi:hypothetical protein